MLKNLDKKIDRVAKDHENLSIFCGAVFFISLFIVIIVGGAYVITEWPIFSLVALGVGTLLAILRFVYLIIKA